MKRFLTASVCALLFALGAAGCAEKESSTSETTIKSPGGTTTIKHDTEVKKTGQNPPAAP